MDAMWNGMEILGGGRKLQFEGAHLGRSHIITMGNCNRILEEAGIWGCTGVCSLSVALWFEQSMIPFIHFNIAIKSLNT